ncbi:MAG: class I SAM-dependent methyltransferase [Candidatus Levybacteria bacterium]|nr:class I SAM-dependent methyltransferase [Candidatus Levybacteria bacterium]
MSADYKELNEGRYTTLHDYTSLSLLEKIYFNFSPGTIVLRRLFKILDQHIQYSTQKNPKILDVGCGGGMKELALRGNVTGIDISDASLDNAEKIYEKVIAYDLSKSYPFPDESFDIVFCSEVYGHIDVNDKNHFMNEIKRVLKKDGFFLFSVETDGNNWLTRYLRRKKMYKKLWVDFDGHIGLETPKKTITRFEKRFRSVNFMVNNTYVFTVDELASIFPVIALLAKNTMVRRIINLSVFPLYELSIRAARLSSANNICIYGKK